MPIDFTQISEAPTPSFRDSVIMFFGESYPNIDLYGVYCLTTGNRIGSSHEMDDLIRSFEGTDPEEVADDIAIRLFASMRPGLFWNKMTLRTVATLQTTRPVETLAWLLNRLMNPPNFKGDVFAIHHDRILAFQWCQALDSETRTKLLDRLIALDARLNLNAQLADFTIDSLHLDGAKTLDRWLDSAEKRAAKLEAAREVEAKWHRDGNTMSRAASVETFFKSKPPSQAKVIDSEKRKTSALMDNLLAALMSGTATPDSRSVETPSAPTQPKLAPSQAGSGLAFLKKKAG